MTNENHHMDRRTKSRVRPGLKRSHLRVLIAEPLGKGVPCLRSNLYEVEKDCCPLEVLGAAYPHLLVFGLATKSRMWEGGDMRTMRTTMKGNQKP
jgi:hypothetical protein